jgi:hypothetical protein
MVRDIVYNALSAVCDRVYYQEAPQGAIYPYVVYSFPSEEWQLKDQERYILEVLVYDIDKNGYNVANEIESLTRKLDDVLNYKSLESADNKAWFYRVSRLALPYVENIWRRELRYRMRNYRR